MADPIDGYIKIIRADIHKYWGGFFSNCPKPIKRMRQVIDHPGVLADDRTAMHAVLRLASDQLKKHGLKRKPDVDGKLGEYVAETDEAKKYLKTTRGQFYFKHLTELERIIRQQNKLYEQEQAAASASSITRKP